MSNEVLDETLAPTTTTTTTTVTISDPVVLIPTSENNDIVLIIRTSLLIVLLVLSLLGNSLIILSVAQARSSRFIPFNAFILSMASFGLLECALTMSLATGFSIEKIWKFGNFLAGFNASFVQLQNVGVILTILAMSIDRYISVTCLTTYHGQSSVHRANYVVLYTWIHAFIFSLPLLFQNESLGISCRPFVERFLCALEEGTTIIFTSLLTGLCYFLPMFLVVVFLFLVKLKEFKEKQRLNSINTAGYAAYCMQESLLLKEASWCKYVAMLFLLFILFKMPYIVIDIMTQLGFKNVFKQELEGNVINGSRFYYQTAISWLMFCFSAFYPILTFLQFPDHWRNIKRCMTCTNISTSISNNLPLTRSERQLRQNQRRLRQRQRKASRLAQNKKKIPSVASVPQLPSSSDKPSSSSINNITSEKVTVNAAVNGEEVMFRVPVLYAAVDGLHLVASEKTLPAKNEVKKKKNKNLSLNISNKESVVDASLGDPVEKTAQPSSGVVDDLRPSSVVDKRVDVTGSRDCIHSDDDIYLNSDSDIEETTSELNESANSRTLIWPNKAVMTGQSTSFKVGEHRPKTVWQSSSAQDKGADKKSKAIQNAPVDNTKGNSDFNDKPPHPHTPSPPPVDEDFHSYHAQSSSNNIDNSSLISDHILEKIRFSKLKLPSIKSQNIPSIGINKPVDQLTRTELLLSADSVCSHGSEIPPTCSSRNSNDSVVIKSPKPLRSFVFDKHLSKKAFPSVDSARMRTNPIKLP